MVKERYDSARMDEELEFTLLKPRHARLINDFTSYQTDLEEYLKEDAIRALELCIGSTFLIFDKSDFKKNRKNPEKLTLLGYITICTDAINLNGDLKDVFRSKGIQYKSLPAVKIGRLCIDDQYLGRGLGSCALAWVVRRTVYFNDTLACRYITLDAKRHPDAKKDSFHFYRKYAFEVLKPRGKTMREIAEQRTGTTPMYFDMHRIIQEYRKK